MGLLEQGCALWGRGMDFYYSVSTNTSLIYLVKGFFKQVSFLLILSIFSLSVEISFNFKRWVVPECRFLTRVPSFFAIPSDIWAFRDPGELLITVPVSFLYKLVHQLKPGLQLCAARRNCQQCITANDRDKHLYFKVHTQHNNSQSLSALKRAIADFVLPVVTLEYDPSPSLVNKSKATLLRTNAVGNDPKKFPLASCYKGQSGPGSESRLLLQRAHCEFGSFLSKWGASDAIVRALEL